QDADRRIAGRDDLLQGDIRVTIAGPLAVAAFAPRLAEFTNAYPGLSVHLDTRVDFADLARREADIAIRMDNSPTETLVGKRLFPYFETVYASPGYLAAHKIDQYPKSARWLGWKDPPEPHPDWTAKTEFSAVPVWGCFPDPHLQQAAARNGLGLAMLPCILGDMDPGLVRATKRPPTPARDIWILTHPDLRRVARVKAFTTFAETVLRSLEAELKGERPQSA
ncbi:MAG: LysR substrate-binding domain-containing protein, partial [Pseudomonadota bacterium]